MSAYIAVELQRQIRNRFANCCAYCRTAEALTVTTFEFEHITPRSAGGESTLENLCFSCPSCNRYISHGDKQLFTTEGLSGTTIVGAS
jgi:5-methylcytosine-specific restriction endonuclease McrA